MNLCRLMDTLVCLKIWKKLKNSYKKLPVEFWILRAFFSTKEGETALYRLFYDRITVDEPSRKTNPHRRPVHRKKRCEEIGQQIAIHLAQNSNTKVHNESEYDPWSLENDEEMMREEQRRKEAEIEGDNVGNAREDLSGVLSFQSTT